MSSRSQQVLPLSIVATLLLGAALVLVNVVSARASARAGSWPSCPTRP